MDTPILKWARLLKSWSQTGLQYSKNPYDRERYADLAELAAEMIATQYAIEVEPVRDMLSRETGPGTPKVDVRGVVFRDDKILMVREVNDHHRWTLPGGWADVNETPSQATVREVYEESGFETRAVKLLALFDKHKGDHDHPPDIFYIYKLYFLCEITGGEPKQSLETSAVGFFAEDALPDDLSLGRVTLPVLRRLFEHHRNPDLPTDFD